MSDVSSTLPLHKAQEARWDQISARAEQIKRGEGSFSLRSAKYNINILPQ